MTRVIGNFWNSWRGDRITMGVYLLMVFLTVGLTLFIAGIVLLTVGDSTSPLGFS